MKFDFTFQALGTVLNSMIRHQISDKTKRREIKQAYKEIVLRASDIGSKNKLITSYALAAFFIAMNRKSGLTPQECYEILDQNMRTSKLLKAFMGDSKHYFSEQNMESRRAWSKQTYERKYPNDWVVDVIEKSDQYEFGLDYHECGVCKLCRDENCFELAKYLCRLDFLLVEIIGIRLTRTMTLADGCEKCDFRFSSK